MPYKLFNPDSAEFKVAVRKPDGTEVARVAIPACGYAIVTSVEGIMGVYAQIQITEASEAEYEAYRKDVARKEKEEEVAAEKAAEAAIAEAEAEAARSEAKIAAREKKAAEERKAELERQIGVVRSADTTSVAEVEQPRRGRPKKGE